MRSSSSVGWLAVALVACGSRTGLESPPPPDAGLEAEIAVDAQAPGDSGMVPDATFDSGADSSADSSVDSSPGDSAPRGDSGLLDAPPACDSSCPIGSSQCVASGVSACIDDGTGCGTWGPPAPCATGSTCAVGGGGASCRIVDLETPRPIAPLSTSRVTSHRPTFRWALAGQDDGAVVEICTDRACTAIVNSFTATGTSGRPSKPLLPGVYFWRLRGAEGSLTGVTPSPVWEVTVPVSDAPVDTSWGSILDIDGDGFADVAVGAHVVVDQGGAFVYTGSATGIAATPVSLLNPFNWYSALVVSGGDLDGDGYPELVVGCNQANGLIIYRGGPAWASTAPVIIAGPSGSQEFGAWVESAGDINGDGYGDLLVSSYDTSGGTSARLYLGSPTGLSVSTENLPAGGLVAVTAVTDVNGDGFSDVLVGIDGDQTTHSGSVNVYLGTPGGLSASPIVMPYTSNAQNFFVVNVASAGDVNGDGYGDVLISVTDAMPTTVEVYLGGPGGLSASPIVLPNPTTGPFFGYRLAGVGDIDGDGFDDFIDGLSDSLSRAAYVYRGSASGPATAPSITLQSPATTGGFGDPVAAIGDVNRDGFADVGVGAINGSASFVYLGAASGLVATPLSASAPAGVQEFGESMASVDVAVCSESGG